MKRFLLLPLLALMILAACSSEIEDNSPAMQAVVNDSLFYKAINVRASYNDQGSLIIRGETDLETLTINLTPPFPSQGNLGEGSRFIVAYTDENGRTFSTANPNGSGFLRPLVGDDRVTVRFAFTAFRNGSAITMSEGIAFDVPIMEPIDPFGDDDDDEMVVDSFTARVNTVSFNPTVTAAASSGGNLSLSGQTSNASISIQLPTNTGQGMYDFAATGAFVGTYRVMDTDFVSESGSLNIISNDTANRVIMGEFSFETSDFSITDGRFTLNY